MATVIEDAAARGAGHSFPQAWARSAPLIAALVATLGILAIYGETVVSIVSIWARSETFAHGFVVLPIALWLGWRKRAELAVTTAKPWLAGLLVILACGALWAIMVVGAVLVAKQFALAFMVQAAIVTVVGWRVARVLGFPLLFLLFAIPAGEILIPTLIEWTADFTVNALRASGVPVYREANHFVIPSGSWSVVEACSGLRYLIASFMIGVLFSAIVYRSLARQIAFIAASIIVPLIANWLRAYLIVMLGHLSGNQIAVGVDHVIYGWIFFGIVLTLLFWVGSFWAERDFGTAVSGSPSSSPADHVPSVARSRFFTAAVAVILVAAIWRPVPSWIDMGSSAEGVAVAPLGSAGTWMPAASPPVDWRPDYKGSVAELRQGFTSGSATAGIYIGHYRGQTKGREMVTSTNALVSPGDAKWREQSRGDVQVDWNGTAVTAYRSTVLGIGTRMTVYRLYWINGTVTASDVMARLLLIWSRLRGQGDDSALIVTYAAESPSGDSARDLLEAYAPALDSSFRKPKQGR